MGQLISTPSTPAHLAPPPEVQASELRAAAKAAGDLRRKYSEESQAAWHDNRKGDAKALSDRSKEAGLEVERLNARAAEIIFTGLNPNYPIEGAGAGGVGVGVAWVAWLFSAGGGGGDGEPAGGGGKAGNKAGGGLGMVDLHGLYVAEAIARVKRHLERCAEAGVDRTTIITGRGLHSQGGVARIKPEVEKWLGEHVAQYRVLAGANGGAFTVELMQEEQKGVLGGVWKFLGW